MILSRHLILERMLRGEIGFDPQIDQFQLQMHSVDLRLGFDFMIPKSWAMTSKGREAIITDPLDFNPDASKHTLINLKEGQFFDLLPGEYIAVTSLEKVKLAADVMGILYPRSSVNRRGLSVDLTGIVDAGYEGKLLIPVRNNTSDQIIRIYPGERFCQIVFQMIQGTVDIEESRWHNTEINVTMQAEKHDDEMEYLRKGRISGLKKDYKLVLPDTSD